MRRNKKKSVIAKDKKIDFTPINEVKKMFKDWFRKNKKHTYTMTKEDVVRNILTKLDAKQNDALEDAMNKLKKEGFMEVKEDGLTLVLTKQGAESL